MLVLRRVFRQIQQDASPNSLWRASSVQFYENYNLNLERKRTVP